MTEARDLAALAARSGRCLMVGHILQYHPAFLALKALVREGRLGRLQRIQANRLNLGAVRREEDVLWCLAPHDVSMVLSLVGELPSRVAATGGYHLRDAIADTATAQLWFPGGGQAQIAVSWLHPYKEHRLAVIGTEAMALAAIIASPSAYDPKIYPENSLMRRNIVLEKMYEQGYITPRAVRRRPAAGAPASDDIEPPKLDSKAPNFTAWLRQQLVERYGASKAFFGGLKVKSTLDLRLQEAAEEALSSYLGYLPATASVVVLDNKNAGVKAMVGGRWPGPQCPGRGRDQPSRRAGAGLLIAWRLGGRDVVVAAACGVLAGWRSHPRPQAGSRAGRAERGAGAPGRAGRGG